MLDWLNIIYFVAQIIKPDFEELDYLVTPIITIAAISKTLIFINNIDIAQKTAIYLQGQLSTRLSNTKNMLIKRFFANLIIKLYI